MAGYYTDILQMIQSIQGHVRGPETICKRALSKLTPEEIQLFELEDHRVQVADDFVRQRLGYTCSTCAISWTIDLLEFRKLDLSTLIGSSMAGILKDRGVRDRLTAYLNWELDDPVTNSPQVVRVSRYKRTPVI
jgi:hypothetical protein